MKNHVAATAIMIWSSVWWLELPLWVVYAARSLQHCCPPWIYESDYAPGQKPKETKELDGEKVDERASSTAWSRDPPQLLDRAISSSVDGEKWIRDKTYHQT